MKLVSDSAVKGKVTFGPDLKKTLCLAKVVKSALELRVSDF